MVNFCITLFLVYFIQIFFLSIPQSLGASLASGSRERWRHTCLTSVLLLSAQLFNIQQKSILAKTSFHGIIKNTFIYDDFPNQLSEVLFRGF